MLLRYIFYKALIINDFYKMNTTPILNGLLTEGSYF
jgi:hypothetical protein